jgi:hypothetical protein
LGALRLAMARDLLGLSVSGFNESEMRPAAAIEHDAQAEKLIERGCEDDNARSAHG